MGKWLVRAICCGRDDGTLTFDTWDEADRFREMYSTGYGVARYGYGSPQHEPGHRRAAIIEKEPADD